MPLHHQCKSFLEIVSAGGGPTLEQLPVSESRKMARRLIDFGGPEETVARVEDREIPGPGGPLRVRTYRPSLEPGLPGLLFFHGGGFVIGDLETHDRLCRQLANDSGCVVVAVDYRMAPEHKFPAAPEDAFAATRYLAEHATEFGVDPDRLGVAGDSAGGNLATVVALMARDRGGPSLRFQLLIYPLVDLDDERPSIQEYGQDHFLSRTLMDWFSEHYVASASERTNPLASPIHANLDGLPPALVITCECDPLRDQGEAYARKLENAGVTVTLKRYEGMIHPFVSLAGFVDDGRRAVADAGAAVRQAMAASASAV